MIGTASDGELDRIAGMACHGGYCAGSLVYRIAPSRTAQGGVLFFHCQQHTVVSLGLARRSLGVNRAAGSAVPHEPQGLEKEQKQF